MLKGLGHPLTRFWRSRTTSRILVVAGAAIAIASLSADRLAGAVDSSIGYKQVLACLFGAGVFSLGFILPKSRQWQRTYSLSWFLALYLAICSTVLWVLDAERAATWILAGYTGAICSLLPSTFGALTFAGLMALHGLLTWISHIKIELTGIPLTMLDLRIAAANPGGLWDAMGLPSWSLYASVVAISLAVSAWFLHGFLSVRRRLITGPLHAGQSELLGRILAVIVLCAISWAYLQALYSSISQDHTTWHHAWVAKLEDRVGVLPFLGYSYHIESSTSGDIYKHDDGVRPPGPEEVNAAVSSYMNFPPHDSREGSLYPNIVVVLAESTFDPAVVFRLNGEWNNYLFEENSLTAARGPLRVNTKGGGTWVAEFETITGLDSRLFGYSGAYTHASLSPFVDKSLVTYMEQRGYVTSAFLPTTGEFYNSRRAYESYGFDRILDSKDLGNDLEWFYLDTDVIESVLPTLGPDPASPFFSYIILIENHGPHTCEDSQPESFSARFVDNSDTAANCALNEYLRRLRSTTSAIQSLQRHLGDIQKKTERPYVLLVFGDHQPMSFTGSGEFVADFTPMRTSLDMYTTFFHLMSTTGRKFDCCSDALPVTALPTLVSGFVANDPSDVYLGENLWLYSHCGTSAILRDFADRMTVLHTRESALQSETCPSAYRRALVSYRRSGIIRLGD